MSSLIKGMDILRTLAEPPFYYNLSELASSMNMGKSGLYKILSSMKDKNFVVQDRSSKKYHLGPVVLRMGNVYSRITAINEISDPILANLCEALGETVYISIWEGDRAYPVCKRCRPGGLYETNDFIGKNIPINAGASAKLLAAYQDRWKIEELLKNTEMEKRTPYTETSIAKIMEEYKTIRAQAYAVEDQSFSLGVWCLSVPISGRDGRVDHCLALGTTKESVTDSLIPIWLQRLRDGAEEIGLAIQLKG